MAANPSEVADLLACAARGTEVRESVAGVFLSPTDALGRPRTRTIVTLVFVLTLTLTLTLVLVFTLTLTLVLVFTLVLVIGLLSLVAELRRVSSPLALDADVVKMRVVLSEGIASTSIAGRYRRHAERLLGVRVEKPSHLANKCSEVGHHVIHALLVG